VDAELIASLVADALVVFGVFIMTVGVYGMIRLPDTYTRLHATSKAVVLGVISLLAASVVTGDPEVIYRVVLIGAFLVLTAPVSAHVIARAAYCRAEKMESPDAVDESSKDLTGR
jgi:multicomponent Na+:H+ antiporter subunit G